MSQPPVQETDRKSVKVWTIEISKSLKYAKKILICFAIIPCILGCLEFLLFLSYPIELAKSNKLVHRDVGGKILTSKSKYLIQGIHCMENSIDSEFRTNKKSILPLLTAQQIQNKRNLMPRQSPNREFLKSLKVTVGENLIFLTGIDGAPNFRINGT